jgi:hypothetical protein
VARTSFARRPPAPAAGDLDRLVLTGDALRRCASPFEVANLVAPVAADLGRAAGAAVHLEAPGRGVQSVRFGAAPTPATDATVELLLACPAPGATTIAVPTSGALAAAMSVHGASGRSDPSVTNVLTLLAQQAGAALDRLQASAVEPDRLDPLTGVGNGQQAMADVAGVRRGDALLLVVLDDAAPIGSMWGLAAYLRSRTRPPADTIARLGDRQLVVVLRDLRSPVDVVADRLLRGWRATAAPPHVAMGAAVHGSVAPLETLDRAAAALAGARSLGRDRLHVAPDVRVPAGL